MGITIHYKGTIKEFSKIEEFQNEMITICQAMNWEYRLCNEDLTKSFDATLVHTEKGTEIKGHIPLKGITIVIDRNNGGMNFLFNPAGKLTSFLTEIMIHDGSIKDEHRWEFIKTQYGTVDSHVATVKLLRYIKEKFIPNLKVIDEGEYWGTNNREHLMGKRAFLAGKIAQFGKALSLIEFEGEPTTGEIIKKIEDVFRSMNKRDLNSK